jgi:hypothetical protein
MYEPSLDRLAVFRDNHAADQRAWADLPDAERREFQSASRNFYIKL